MKNHVGGGGLSKKTLGYFSWKKIIFKQNQNIEFSRASFLSLYYSHTFAGCPKNNIWLLEEGGGGSKMKMAHFLAMWFLNGPLYKWRIT